MKKHKQHLRDLWDTIKQINIHIMRVLERQKTEKGAERISEEVLAENFPNLMKDMNINIQETPKKMTSKRPTPRHIIIKLPKS